MAIANELYYYRNFKSGAFKEANQAALKLIGGYLF
jgi:hypothetical protein